MYTRTRYPIFDLDVMTLSDVAQRRIQRGEVERLWKEILGSYKHDEFNSQPELKWGIGVLWK